MSGVLEDDRIADAPRASDDRRGKIRHEMYQILHVFPGAGEYPEQENMECELGHFLDHFKRMFRSYPNYKCNRKYAP